MIVKQALVLHAFLCLPILLQAQTLPDSIPVLEKVVIHRDCSDYIIHDASSSLRIAGPLQYIPQNIQVVTAKLICDQQVTDMTDVSKNVSGAAISSHENWGNYSNIFMRGGPATAFRNGMNVKMPWGPLAEDMSMVERIEFVKGPAGFLMANGEPTAIYNIVTKKPTGVSKGEVSIASARFDLYRVTTDLDGKLNSPGNLLYRLNVVAQSKNSHRQFDFNKRFAIAPVISYKAGDNTLLTAEYTYQQMRMPMLGSAYLFSLKMGDLPRHSSMLEENITPAYINDQSLFITLDHCLSEHFKLTTKLAYLEYQQEGASVWPAHLDSNGNLLRGISNWDAYSECRSGQVYANGKITTGSIEHNVLGGIDVSYKTYYADFYQYATITGYDNFGNSVPFNIYNPVHGKILPQDIPMFDRTLPLRERAFCTLGESLSSIYFQDELHLGVHIRATLAGRYCRLLQNSFGVYSEDKKFSPRIGLSYVIGRSASGYALYDCSFIGQQGTDSASHPFKPLTGRSIEAGLKKEWLNGIVNTTVSVYQVKRNNLITYLPGPESKAVQTKQTRTRGIELDIRGDVSKKLSLIANYAFTKAVITKDVDESKVGEQPDGPGVPEHIGNLWMNYKIASIWRASLGYQWQAKRQHDLPAYHRFDANVSVNLKTLTIALMANNIFDKYLYSGAPFEFNNDPASSEYYFQVEAGVNFRIDVTYRF